MPVAHAFVVDDEEIVRNSLSRLLRAIGITSSSFASGEAFLEQYRGAPDDERGCLIVDIRMPGMSGLDLLEVLQRRGSTLPAIVITGHTDEGSLLRFERLEAVGLLEKPFSLAQLKEMLARCGEQGRRS
jgi:two-component system, LuxR family, response regulator FixJ